MKEDTTTNHEADWDASPCARRIDRTLTEAFAGTRFHSRRRDGRICISWFDGPAEPAVRAALARIPAEPHPAGAIAVRRKLRGTTENQARRRWLTVCGPQDEYGWHPAIVLDGVPIPHATVARQIRLIAEHVVLGDPLPAAPAPAGQPLPWTVAVAALLRDAMHRGVDLPVLLDEVEAVAHRLRREHRHARDVVGADRVPRPADA